jgi:site-specific DNA recombinase
MDTHTIGIYTRISRDPDGTETATARQEADCRELIAREWPQAQVQVYCDTDRSAFDPNVVRPGFEAMLTDLRSGHLDGVVAWKWDRLTRTPLDAGRIHDAVSRTGRTINTVTDPIAWDDPSAALLIGVRAGLGHGESKSTSLRVKRVAEQQAREGRPAPSRYRPFGYSRDWTELIPDEAQVVRAMVDEVLAGSSLSSIARGLNEEGVRTTSGGTWNLSNVRDVLTSARLIGAREYEGQVYEGPYIARMIERDTWEQVQAIMRDPSRLTRTDEGMKRPLSGLVRCSGCGELMHVRSRASEGRPPSYRCTRKPDGRGCNSRSIAAEPLEELVLAILVERLEGEPLARAIAGRDDADDAAMADQLLSLRQRREDALAMFGEGYLDRAELTTTLDTIAQERAPIEAALARSSGMQAVAAMKPGETIAEAWRARGVAWQRQLARAIIGSIEIAPNAVRGRQSFDADRVNLTFIK